MKIKGVNPLQLASAVHPKVKQIRINASGVGFFPLTYPVQAILPLKKIAGYSEKPFTATKGFGGFYVALDDKSVAVYAALWEEG